MESKKINLTKLEYNLVSVNFNIDQVDEVKLEFDIFDDLQFESYNDNRINALYLRNVIFNKEKDLGIKVVYRITGHLDENGIKHFKNELEKMMKFINKNKAQISNDTKAGSESSLIIGQLTATMKIGPVIIPPYFISKNENQS